jgi:hypothetical protein
MESIMMKEKFKVLPKRIARSRKIQVRQFEPEEIWIEYELDIQDPSSSQEAVREATRLANEYLDEEEARLRSTGGRTVDVNSGGKPSVTRYDLVLTEEGKQKNLQIIHSKESQYANFVHLWYGNNGNDPKTYIGHLRKDTGEFKLKIQNKPIIEKQGIKQGMHFKVIPA